MTFPPIKLTCVCDSLTTNSERKIAARNDKKPLLSTDAKRRSRSIFYPPTFAAHPKPTERKTYLSRKPDTSNSRAADELRDRLLRCTSLQMEADGSLLRCTFNDPDGR